MSKLFKPLDWIENATMVVSSISLLLITVLTTVDVFLRKVTSGQSITSLYEITEEYLMVSIVFLALSHVYKIGGHVRVTMITDRFIPKALIGLINRVMNFVYLGFFGLLTVQCFRAALQAWEFNEVSSTILAYPLAPALMLVPIGTLLVCLRLLQHILRNTGDALPTYTSLE